MAYNRSYNPDALPAHIEPDQAAAALASASRPDRDRRSGGGSGGGSKPPPPAPSRYDDPRGGYGRAPPPQQDPRYDDPRRGGGGGRPISTGGYGGGGPGGVMSPLPQSYGWDDRRNHDRPPPPGQGAHGRPPISNYRTPPTPMPPREGNDRDALWPMFRQVDKDGVSASAIRRLHGRFICVECCTMKEDANFCRN
jgi:peflin